MSGEFLDSKNGERVSGRVREAVLILSQNLTLARGDPAVTEDKNSSSVNSLTSESDNDPDSDDRLSGTTPSVPSVITAEGFNRLKKLFRVQLYTNGSQKLLAPAAEIQQMVELRTIMLMRDAELDAARTATYGESDKEADNVDSVQMIDRAFPESWREKLRHYARTQITSVFDELGAKEADMPIDGSSGNSDGASIAGEDDDVLVKPTTADPLISAQLRLAATLNHKLEILAQFSARANTPMKKKKSSSWLPFSSANQAPNKVNGSETEEVDKDAAAWMSELLEPVESITSLQKATTFIIERYRYRDVQQGSPEFHEMWPDLGLAADSKSKDSPEQQLTIRVRDKQDLLQKTETGKNDSLPLKDLRYTHEETRSPTFWKTLLWNLFGRPETDKKYPGPTKRIWHTTDSPEDCWACMFGHFAPEGLDWFIKKIWGKGMLHQFFCPSTQQQRLDADMAGKLNFHTKKAMEEAFREAYDAYKWERYGSFCGTPEGKAPKQWLPSALTVARLWLKHEKKSESANIPVDKTLDELDETSRQKLFRMLTHPTNGIPLPILFSLEVESKRPPRERWPGWRGLLLNPVSFVNTFIEERIQLISMGSNFLNTLEKQANEAILRRQHPGASEELFYIEDPEENERKRRHDAANVYWETVYQSMFRERLEIMKKGSQEVVVEKTESNRVKKGKYVTVRRG